MLRVTRKSCHLELSWSVSRRDEERQHTLPRHGMYHVGLPLHEASEKQWSQAALLGRPVMQSTSVRPCLPYSPINSQRIISSTKPG